MDLGKAMAACPLPRGPRVAILSGQAGPAMAACDVCQSEGLQVTAFESATQETIHGLLPPLALRSNPVDMGPAWYDSEAIRGIVKAVMADDNVDGILILMMFASANREAINGLSDLLSEWNQEKPVVGCLVSPPGIWDEAISRMEKEGALVNLPTPERAANVMAAMWKYAHMLDDKRLEEIMNVIEQALKQGRNTLSEYESKELLKAYGIHVTKETVVKRRIRPERCGPGHRLSHGPQGMLPESQPQDGAGPGSSGCAERGRGFAGLSTHHG